MRRDISIYVGNDRLDLYDDESVVITRQAQNVRDITKVYTDYSQTFTVPASSRNNRIFRHWYNADIDNGFNNDARVKQLGRVEIGTLPFIPARIRLEGATVKMGRPLNYRVTIFGILTALTDRFKNDTLRDLEFSDLDHSYNAANMRAGLSVQNGLFGGKLIYTLINPRRRMFFSTMTGDLTDDSQNINIANRALKNSDLTIGMQIVDIVRRIEEKYGINFTGGFMDGSNPQYEFMKSLYMSIGNSENGPVLRTREHILHLADNSFEFAEAISPEGCNRVLYMKHAINIYPEPGYENVPYKIRVYDSTNRRTVLEGNFTGITEDFGHPLSDETVQAPASRLIRFYMEVSNEFRFSGNMVKTTGGRDQLCRPYSETEDLGPFRSESMRPVLGVLIGDSMPDMTVKDFVTAFVKACNCTIVPESDTDFRIMSLNDWYTEGRIREGFERYIDNSQYDVLNRDLVNEFNLKWQEPETFLQVAFEENFDRYYGDLSYAVEDNDGEQIDGEPLSVEMPFENMIYERMINARNGALTSIVWGYKVDEDRERLETEPVLFFNVFRSVTANPIGIDDGNGGVLLINQSNMPSHVPPGGGVGLSFNEDIEEYSNTPMSDNLYSRFYGDYVSDIFSPKRRLFSFNAILPPHVMTDIRLNDLIIIYGRRYIVNSVEMDLTNGRCKFELLNDIF